FQDPNSPDWKPSTSVLVRKSVLSAVMEDTIELRKRLGAEDRVRLDQHLTSIRELEQRLAVQLDKPPPAAACKGPGAPGADGVQGVEINVLKKRHQLMVDLAAAAIACDQTRVFNIFYSASLSNTVKEGVTNGH